MNKFLSFLLLMVVSICGYAQTFNMVETSYVTSTISQTVVFNSAMQAGGTLTFSVDAHNGGGNANTNDTANVKILFYNSSNTLLNTATTNYSRNLAIPTGYHGVDPNVPWSNLSITSTNCGGSCANVAYVKVQMVGIDGSYWAGDYGPYYRQPVLSFNGGPNILYNPQFGTAPNGTLVQGWTASPNWGVCQGAYGGSNSCSTNYSSVPANGGNYIASGGTTSAPAGGTPAAPTVTSTTTTNQTKTIIVGSQQQTTTTPVTTTNYSDGTHTTSSGSSTTTTVSNTAFTGVHFGGAQVADTQWNVDACTQTSSCQVYSTSPGGTYNTGSWTPVASDQYITFIPNTASDSATNPWRMILVNSDGTFTDLGSCHILVQGTDSNGNIFLFVSNDQWNGTLLSGNLGLTGQGVTFTGTANPTMSDTNTLSGNMSSTPLAPGQTGGTPIPPPTSTSQEMNVSAQGSNYVFIWQGNSGSDWNNVLAVRPGWYWTCPTCDVTSGVVQDYNYPASDSAYFYLVDNNGNAVTPNSGYWYTFNNAPAPVVVSTSTTNQVTSTDSVGSTTTTSNQYTWRGGNYTVTGTSTPTTTTVTTTPVTTTNWSDGTTTTSNGSTTTTSSINFNYTVTDPNPPVSPYRGTNTNGVYITQVNAGSANNVTADQSGHGNYEEVRVGGSNNTINVGQGYTFSTSGSATENSVSIENVSGVTVSGNSNTVTNSQLGATNSTVVNITGNNNGATVNQNGNNNQAYSTISGNSNSLAFSQNGNGNIAAANLFGNNNTATVSQTGNNHGTVLNLVNAGGANNVSVIQTGNGDAYSLQQICTNPAGCSVSVIRNK